MTVTSQRHKTDDTRRSGRKPQSAQRPLLPTKKLRGGYFLTLFYRHRPVCSALAHVSINCLFHASRVCVCTWHVRAMSTLLHRRPRGPARNIHYQRSDVSVLLRRCHRPACSSFPIHRTIITTGAATIACISCTILHLHLHRRVVKPSQELPLYRTPSLSLLLSYVSSSRHSRQAIMSLPSYHLGHLIIDATAVVEPSLPRRASVLLPCRRQAIAAIAELSCRRKAVASLSYALSKLSRRC